MLSDDDAAAAWHSDEEGDASTAHLVTDPEEWMDHWSEELVTMWHSLQEQAGALGAAVLDRCSFPHFAEFCFKHSSGYPPSV